MTTSSHVDAPSPPSSAPAGTARGARPAAGRWRSLAASGWPPAALLAGLTVAALRHYGVPAGVTAVFAAYLLLCVALPGVLLVRALHPGPRPLAEDLALGLTAGYAAEVLAYVAARAADRPLLVLLWPAVTYAAFLLHPRLRRHWRGGPRPAAPRWWPWFLALTGAYLVGWSAFTCWRVNALTWPAAGAAHVDMPYNLALIGELRHHVPPTVPVVAGEPLHYHWFAYAHAAASGWITGIEPLTLLLRLSVLPMLMALAVIVAMTGRRITGSRAGAVLAVAGTLLVAAPSLYAGANGLLRWTGVLHVPWNSPTQTFGALMFAPLVLLVADLLTRPGAGRARWALFALLLVAVMGAKATYLPLLAAGLVAAAAAGWAVRRRPPREALAALGMTAAALAFAQLVLFGGARQGTTVAPLSVVRATWADLTGAGQGAVPGPASLAATTLLFALCWAVTWCGALGLLGRPGLLLRPPVAFTLGMTAAGAGLMLLLGTPGDLNQAYFLQACYPYLAVLAAYGLVRAVRRERWPLAAVAGAAAAGMALAYLVRELCGVEAPLALGRPEAELYLPFAALLAAVVTAAGLLAVSGTSNGLYNVDLLRDGGRAGLTGRLPGLPGDRARGWALLLVAVTAAGVPGAWQARVLSHLRGGADVNISADGRPDPAQVPRGALAATRWLRAHSLPGELVATNAHCQWARRDVCDSRHFWVSALTERRVLVEGWAYTAANLDRRPGGAFLDAPFLDAARLEANDAVFLRPSAEAVARLRDGYGVRWLVADERAAGHSARIGRFASLRVRHGDYAVYRLPDADRS
ncbi:hypothetical protein [Sphaerisporangium sp. TRM90804]|uniref:hypothetical protein n=1 Tax=Sphaerisporangium sp. TRM90804 TaxID=3031113 RepID=UPI00244D176F|nr:hypothetical protein [Sphaerisporangium sp. TRM90804]MDH2424124.1 hypothetical protein [Sphaerisporangium sp. TRM90804]